MIRFYLAAIFAVVPNLVILAFNDPFETPKRILFIFLIFILLVHWVLTLKNRFVTFEVGKIDIAVLLFLLSYFLSTIFSIEILTSTSASIFILTCVCFYFLVKNLYKTKIVSFVFISWSIIAGGAVAWVYYFYTVGALKILFTNPVYLIIQNPPLGLPSTQIHQIVFSFYLLGIFWLSLIQGKRLLIISGLLLWVILLTEVRGAVLALITETVILLIIFRRKTVPRFIFRKKIIPKLSLLSVVAGILIILVFSATAYFKTTLWQRFLLISKQPPAVNSLNLRLAENVGAIKVFLERPILGYGPNTIQFTYPRYKPDFINQNEQEWLINISDIRNHYLNIASTTGILGLLSFLSVIYFSLKSIFNTNLDHKSTAIFGLWLSILLTSLLYYQTAALAVLFWGSLGLLSAHLKEKTIISFRFSTRMLTILAAGVILIGIGTTTISNYYLPHLITKGKVSLESLKNQNPDEFTIGRDALKKALLISPHNIEAKRILALLYFYQVQLDPKEVSLLDQSIDLSRQVISADPYQPLNYDVLGQILLHKGQLKEAEENFRKAISLKDNYLAFKYHLEETLKQQGR